MEAEAKKIVSRWLSARLATRLMARLVASFALALASFAPVASFGAEAGVDGNALTGETLFGDVDGAATTVGDVLGVSLHSRFMPFRFDFCLSPFGDDANDGLTLATAKRTIAAAVSAANADGGTNLVVAVLPGDYVPPYADFGATNAIIFRAVGEKSATRIVGGTNAVCAISSAPCEWCGFTFTGFDGVGASSDGYTICRFGSMAFDDCDFIGNSFRADYGYAAHNSCEFRACKFDRNVYAYVQWYGNSSYGVLYRDCVMNDCSVDGVTITDDKASSNTWYQVLMSGVAATNSVFRLPGSLYSRLAGRRVAYKNVTIIAPTAWCATPRDTNHNRPFQTNGVENCFFVIEDATFNDDGTVDAGPYTATGFPRRIDGAYVVANSTANLTADGVAADMDCPSVRDDGLPDYGYKSSGLGAAKTALAAKSAATNTYTKVEVDKRIADAIADAMAQAAKGE